MSHTRIRSWLIAVVVCIPLPWIPALATTQVASAQDTSEPAEPTSSGATEAPTNDSPEPTEEQRAEAREAYGRGQQLFQEGQFAEAEDAFSAAFDAVPNPVVLLSVAECQERDGRGAESSRTLRRYLELRPDAPDRGEVTERIIELQNRPAMLVITSNPEGARINVNGQERPEVTPAEIEAAPERYTVTLGVDGYIDAVETVTAEFATVYRIDLTLEEAPPPNEDPFGTLGAGPGYDAEAARADDDENEGVSPGVWVAAGIGGAGLVAGTVLGFLALSEQADFDDMPSEDSADRGERFALFADVSFGIAAAAGLTAVVLYLTNQEGDEEPVADASTVDSGAQSDDEGDGEAIDTQEDEGVGESASVSWIVAPVADPVTGAAGLTGVVQF